jgi:hypothetical protein
MKIEMTEDQYRHTVSALYAYAQLKAKLAVAEDHRRDGIVSMENYAHFLAPLNNFLTWSIPAGLPYRNAEDGWADWVTTLTEKVKIELNELAFESMWEPFAQLVAEHNYEAKWRKEGDSDEARTRWITTIKSEILKAIDRSTDLSCIVIKGVTD